MAYSVRQHVTKHLQQTGSEIAVDECAVTSILDRVFDLIQNNPPLTAKEAVNLLLY